MRTFALQSMLAALLLAACGTAPGTADAGAARSPSTPDGGASGGRTGSFPLPSYWGTASQYAVPATITVTGPRSLMLHGGAFGVTDTTPGQPWAALAPSIWIAYGDPIFGIADGIFSYDVDAVFRPKDGLLAPRVITAGDLDQDSFAEFGDARAGWGAHPDAMGDLRLAITDVSPAGTSPSDARRAGTYLAVHGTLDVTLPPVRGDPQQAETIHVEF